MSIVLAASSHLVWSSVDLVVDPTEVMTLKKEKPGEPLVFQVPKTMTSLSAMCALGVSGGSLAVWKDQVHPCGSEDVIATVRAAEGKRKLTTSKKRKA